MSPKGLGSLDAWSDPAPVAQVLDALSPPDNVTHGNRLYRLFVSQQEEEDFVQHWSNFRFPNGSLSRDAAGRLVYEASLEDISNIAGFKIESVTENRSTGIQWTPISQDGTLRLTQYRFIRVAGRLIIGAEGLGRDEPPEGASRLGPSGLTPAEFAARQFERNASNSEGDNQSSDGVDQDE